MVCDVAHCFSLGIGFMVQSFSMEISVFLDLVIRFDGKLEASVPSMMGELIAYNSFLREPQVIIGTSLLLAPLSDVRVVLSSLEPGGDFEF